MYWSRPTLVCIGLGSVAGAEQVPIFYSCSARQFFYYKHVEYVQMYCDGNATIRSTEEKTMIKLSGVS